jgi:hypothetical protein
MMRQPCSPKADTRQRSSTTKKTKCGHRGEATAKVEGPYLAKNDGRPCSFYLTDSEGKTTTHTWNIDNLRRFYI